MKDQTLAGSTTRAEFPLSCLLFSNNVLSTLCSSNIMTHKKQKSRAASQDFFIIGASILFIMLATFEGSEVNHDS